MTTRTIKISLFFAVLLLLALNFYLLYINSEYRRQNRALILQNDSILSVNLELKQGLSPNTQSTVLNNE